ncbi:PTS sugar transporter subunit IIC [Vagococcus fluvialis]|uniref:PTS sugar transporter subunit IIC n=1 Tax=Vagococcus fluvialis TaxID=2738 RepID=UPI003D10570B
MNKFISVIENKLTPIGEKVGKNKILKIISNSFNYVLPVIIIGALASLVSSIQIPAYQEFLTKYDLKPFLALSSTFTTGIVSIFVVFCVAYTYLKEQDLSIDAVLSGIFAIIAFFIMSPLQIIEVNDTPTQFIGFDYIGSKGLFLAIVIGLLVGFTYTVFLKKDISIKMGDGVPPLVGKSLSSLLPGATIIIVSIVINAIFSVTLNTTVSEWFYSFVTAPLMGFSDSYFSFALLQLLAGLFWFLGIHGGQITMPISMMLFLQAGLANQEAYASGEPMKNIITMGLSALIICGGIGGTLGLSLNMLLFSKSEKNKKLGKLAILPSIFNINEPIMFGTPIILNPILIVPFILVPQITLLIAYVVIKVGLVSLPRIAMGALGIPVLVGGFMTAGVGGLILEIILIVVSLLCYYPFFKVQDNIELNKEKAINK